MRAAADAPMAGDVEDGAILDRLDLGRELVFVAVLFQFALELEDLDELALLVGKLIDRDVLGPPEMRVHALQVLGCKSDFHCAGPFLCLVCIRRYSHRPNEP